MKFILPFIAGLMDRLTGGSQTLKRWSETAQSVIARASDYVYGYVLGFIVLPWEWAFLTVVTWGVFGRSFFGNGAMQGYAIRKANGAAPQSYEEAGTDLVTKVFPFLWNKPYIAMFLYGILISAITIATHVYWHPQIVLLAIAFAFACPLALAFNVLVYPFVSTRYNMSGWEVSEFMRGLLGALFLYLLDKYNVYEILLELIKGA